MKTPFDILLSKEIARSRITLQVADWERWPLAIALLGACFLPVAALIALQTTSRGWSVVTLCSGLLAIGAVVLHQAIALLGEARKLGDPAGVVLRSLRERFPSEVELIAELESASGLDELEYARSRLALEITQIRHRVGFVVGAVEQLGVVPAGAAAYFYAHKLSAEKAIAGPALSAIFAIVVGLYVAAAIFLFATQQLERLSLAMQRAAENKRRTSLPPTGENARGESMENIRQPPPS